MDHSDRPSAVKALWTPVGAGRAGRATPWRPGTEEPALRVVVAICALSWACHTGTACPEATGPRYRGIPEADPSSPALQGPVTLALTGDAMLGRNLADQLYLPDADLWSGLAPALQGVDVAVVNLETTLTDHDEAWPDKAFTFRLSPTLAPRGLPTLPLPDDASLVATVGNNHILDFHARGLHDTLDTLDGLGIPWTGAGRTLEEARRAAIVTTSGGVTVGVLGGGDHCGCDDVCAWAATDDSPGLSWASYRHRDWTRLVQDVVDLRARVQVVVVSLHWGPNWVEGAPPAWMTDLADALIAAGADVVHGHSSHHALPATVRGPGVVVYGPGDLIDDYAPVDGFRNDLSYIARVTVAPGAAPDLQVVPIRIRHDAGVHTTELLSPDDPDAALVREAAHALESP